MFLKVAIALLSASAVAYEVLLMRILSIVQWHHFAAMIISLALLGYGASGALLAAIHDWLRADDPRRWRSLFVACGSLFGLLVLICTSAAQRVDFNPLAVAWDPAQLLSLWLMFILLALPFVLVATAIGLALTFQRRGIAGIYGADLIGAGCGALAVLGLMLLVSPADSLRLIAVSGVLAVAVGALEWRPSASRRWWTAPGLALAAIALWPAQWQNLRLSEYKPLHKALLVPDAERVVELTHPLGMLTMVASPTIPFRHAPGLSLGYGGQLPEQLAVFVDGGSAMMIDIVEADLDEVAYLDYLPSALPYALLDSPEVLILGTAGSGDLLLALRHTAAAIRAIEIHPLMGQLLEDPRNGRLRTLLGQPPVEMDIADARSYLQRDRTVYDLIQIPLAGSIGASASGSRALSASALLTVESLTAMQARLKPGGVLAFSHWLRIPPRENLRLFATAVAFLRRQGVADPSRQLVQIRGWGTVTTLIKNGAFSPGEIRAVELFCLERSFDPTYLPDMPVEKSNRFNRLDEPYLYQGNLQILSDPEAFFSAYKFDIRPATDNRPFFSHTFKWSSLPELLTLAGRAGVPMVEWAYLVLVATLVQATVAAILFILLPLRWIQSEGEAADRWQVPIYFASLGVAFMLVEIGFFQRFGLYLGHPIISVAVVLAGFLVFAGVGSLLTRQGSLGIDDRWRSPRNCTLAIAVVGLIYLVVLPPIMDASIVLPLWGRVAITLTLVAPIAFLMGMPFPLGLSKAAETRVVWVPWAWGVNGSAAVVGAAAAPLIAVHLGIAAVILAGLLGYLVASVSYGRGFAVRRSPVGEEE